MIQFKGFKPDAMQRIAGNLGYQGDMNGFNDYLSQNPDKMNTMNMYQNKAMQMAKGGMVKQYAVGGSVPSFMPMPEQPYTKQENIDQGFYDSPEFARYQKAGMGVGVAAVGYSPYFGRQSSGSIGGDQDKIYEDYLNRTGNTGALQGGESFVPNAVKNPFQGPSIQPLPVGGTGGNLMADVRQENFDRGILPPQAPAYEGESISELQANRAINPSLVGGATVQPVGTNVTANQIVDPRSGQVTGDINTPITTAGTATADAPTKTDANLMTATTVADKVGGVLDTTTAAQGTIDPRAEVDAQATTTTSVSDLEAAQGTAILMENPVQRKVEAGELISGVANAETASKFTEEVQAATATPTEKATVQGQLDTLMQDFEGGATPTWAAGAMRAATSAMAARGLGASSMAGQAIIQATMEAALPVASADAQVFAQFESQNLSNRQQRAMLAAQQRATFMGQEFDQAFQSRVMNASKISDVANMNFTAEQQVALENSRNANTMNMANLSNRQALTMAEAAALSNLDMSNLNNRQQAAVMNAQSFLQMDMANLNNQQQTSMFKSQQQIQSLFTDQAAANAAAQFNASSENQTDQFFANLSTSASQFNASQTNAQNQFNAGQTNAQDRFASEMMNQRDQFNAQNRLVIDQNNANWRRQVATADTASINRANEINAASVLGISNTAYNDLWSYYQDSMEWAWNSAENERQRIVDLASVKLQIDSNADISAAQTDYKSASAWGGLVATMFTSPIGGDTLLGKGLGALTGGLFS